MNVLPLMIMFFIGKGKKITCQTLSIYCTIERIALFSQSHLIQAKDVVEIILIFMARSVFEEKEIDLGHIC